MRAARHGLGFLCALMLVLMSSRVHADRLAQLEKATRDPSWRVRLQAAYVLSKQKEPRAIPILEGLLQDDHESVRTIAKKALASLRAGQSHHTPPAQPQALHITIGGVGAKPKHVSADMTRRLRELLVREFEHTPGLTLGGEPVTGFLIDSSITALNRRATREWVEVNCEISVIVGRLPSKAMVMMTSGGATVQEPKSGRPDHPDTLEVDALEGAVKGAHENLLAYLRTQR